MILKQLNNDNICFEGVCLNKISILTRPIYDIEIDENLNSTIYTSNQIKSILIKKSIKVPDKFIVSIPFNQWTDVIKIGAEEFRLAGLDLATVSLHFMVLIENQTKNEISLYTGDFFTIEMLRENEFFNEIAPKIKKIFFDNKIIKYDLKTHLEIISTFIKEKIKNYSFAVCLPHLGYEDFIGALIKNFNMTVHVNELRKVLLQKSINTPKNTFVDKDGSQPKLIVHRKSKNLTEIRKLYYNHNICTLSFSHLNEFDGETPKIVDYYLTMLQWDQHPTESMVLELFQMLPKQTEFHFIYDNFPCSMAINLYVSANALEDTVDLSGILSLDVSDLRETEGSQNLFSQNSEFLPPFCSSQLPGKGINKDNRFPIPIEITNLSESLPSTREEDEEPVDEFFRIEDFRDLDLGSDIKYLRLVRKPV